MQDERGFALGQLDRVQAMFPRVEGKASFLFAVDIAMLAVLAVNLKLNDLDWHSGLAAVAIIVLAVSLWQLYRAYAPSLDGASRPSLLYFRDIASNTEAGYCAKAKAATDRDVIDDALSQVWRNSEILTKKFDRVQAAFTSTMVAVPLWALFVAAASLKAGTVTIGQ